MSDNTFPSKEFKENLNRYEEARKSGSSVYMEPEDFTDIAEYYHLHGRLDDALEVIDYALQLFPGSTQPLAFRARVAILYDHNVEEAMHYANMIEDKNDFDYYYIVAEIMIADGQVEDAEVFLKKKEQDIDDDDLEDFCLDVATLFADYDIYDTAEAWLSKCKDTEEDDYQELKGRIALSKGHFKESSHIFNMLIDHDPYHSGYWNQLASAQYLANDLSASIESSDFSLAIDPDDPDALLNKANSLTMLGNYEQAIDYYNRYKQLQPLSEVADMGIAAVMMSQNKLEESLRHWKMAESLCTPQSTNRIDICRNLCLVYASLGQFDNAFKAVNQLEDMAVGSSPDTIILKGYIALLAEKPRKARKFFEEAYAKTPKGEKENALYFIAYSYFDCNYMKEAHDILRGLTGSKNSKNFVDLWAFLVRTDYELGLQEQFLDDLKKAIARTPHSTQRELSDIFPADMPVNEFYNYAVQHPFNKEEE